MLAMAMTALNQQHSNVKSVIPKKEDRKTYRKWNYAKAARKLSRT